MNGYLLLALLIHAGIVQVIVHHITENLERVCICVRTAPQSIHPFFSRGGTWRSNWGCKEQTIIQRRRGFTVCRGPTRRYWRSNLGSRASITELRSATSTVPAGKDGGLNQIKATKRNGPVPRPTLASHPPDSPNWLLARILVIASVRWGGRSVV